MSDDRPSITSGGPPERDLEPPVADTATPTESPEPVGKYFRGLLPFAQKVKTVRRFLNTRRRILAGEPLNSVT
jgi:hypothetical protein